MNAAHLTPYRSEILSHVRAVLATPRTTRGHWIDELNAKGAWNFTDEEELIYLTLFHCHCWEIRQESKQQSNRAAAAPFLSIVK
jgi:hypothetical protein